MANALREILAYFAIELDSKELEKGDSLVDSMVDKLKGFGKTVAGAFAFDAVLDFGKSLIDQADQVGLIAQRLDVSTDALQEWQYAAKLSDIEATELTASLQRLGAGLAEAAAGKGQAETFKKLGVNLKNTDGTLKSSLQVFEEAGLAIGALQDPTEAAGYAANLFGKQYARLLPLFKEGPEGLAALRKEYQELGGGFSAELIEQSQEFNDNLDRLAFGLKALAKQAFAPLVTGALALTRGLLEVTKGVVAFSKRVARVAKSLVDWTKKTKLLQAILFAVANRGVAILTRLGARLIALGVTAVPKLVAAFGGLRVILGRLAAFVLRFIAPLLILEDIIVFLSGGKSALGKGLDAAFGPGTAKKVQDLVAEIGKLMALFKSAPGEVRAAFASLPKDLEQIFGGFGSFLGGWGQNIVEVGLFVTNALTGGWDNFVAKAKAGGRGILLALKIVWTEVKFAGLAAAAALSDAFDAVWNGIIRGAQNALNAMLDVLAKLPGTDDLVKTLKVKVEGLSSLSAAGGAGENISQLRDQARLAIAREGDVIGAAATAPAGGAAGTSVINNTEVHVTVPPGTPETMARDVGKAAGTASGKASLRGTKAALVPTAG